MQVQPYLLMKPTVELAPSLLLSYTLKKTLYATNSSDGTSVVTDRQQVLLRHVEWLLGMR